MPSTSETTSNCLPPPSAPHLFSSFSCGKFILLLSFSQRTPLHRCAQEGHLEVCHLLVESKADVAARSRCFSPPPSHHLSLTICLAAVATLHSNTPSTATKPTLLYTCAASALLNDAPPRAAIPQIKTLAPNHLRFVTIHRIHPIPSSSFQLVTGWRVRMKLLPGCTPGLQRYNLNSASMYMHTHTYIYRLL
jgi:hypothetical protein